MDLSVLIPARNEMFLAKTVEDVLEHAELETEVIVVLDGGWPDPPLPIHPKLVIAYLPESVGQRAATNLAARLARGRYLMKLDAHCAMDQGFDRKMIELMEPDMTMVPVMRNLHAFDWVCPQGHRRYQGPSGPCAHIEGTADQCGLPTEREIVWIPKSSPQSRAYRFDRSLHFQYWKDFEKRAAGSARPLSETMSLQGSCFLVEREKYFELDLCDESHGSWGQQGVEVACKTWLSGGRVVVNHNTWYAHMFRTQGGDFGFPYPLSGDAVERARARSRALWLENGWEKAVRPLSWLLGHFAPVPDWPGTESKAPQKGIIYYTDNRLNVKLAKRCQRQIERANLPIISCSRKPMPHFGKNVVVRGDPGALQMFRQILAALEASDAEYIFFCEHDVLYHPSHFEFVPPRKDIWYYNTNVWKMKDGRAWRVDDCRQVSGICVSRDLALEHYRKRVQIVEKDGFSMAMGYEPGTHTRKEGVDASKSEKWESRFPNIDIRHGGNLSPTKQSPGEYRNPIYAAGWIESEEIPGWGKVSI